jgi:hypothetical protein
MRKVSSGIAAALCVGLGVVSMAHASSDRSEMIKKLDMLDKLEVQELVAAAQKCAQAENFSCAREKLAIAGRHVVDGEDRGWIAKNADWVEQVALAAQRRRDDEERRRRDEEERARASTARSTYSLLSCRSIPSGNLIMLNCMFQAQGSSAVVMVPGSYHVDKGMYFASCRKNEDHRTSVVSSQSDVISFIVNTCSP